MRQLSTNRPLAHEFGQRIERPGWIVTALFLLLFSGPPSFRVRDPEASLGGEIDYVVVLRLIVLMAATFWLLYQWRSRSHGIPKSLPFKLRLPQKLGLTLVTCLALSVFVSIAPTLSAFKVFEMLITLSFTASFVEIYGTEECLKKIYLSCFILCVAVSVCVFVAPDLVLFSSETGATRLRGELIAPTEIVATLGIILLVARTRSGMPTFWGLASLAFLGTLVAFSLSRTAYLVLAVFFVLYVWKLRNRLYLYLAGVGLVALSFSNLMNAMNEYRDPESLFTLSDRLGLWGYLATVTLQKSPLFGLGYYSASRIYGPEYNEGLGTAHSMFLETFVGGGLLSLVSLILLCLVVGKLGLIWLRDGANSIGFTLSAVWLATLMFGSIGGDFGYGPLGITFWSLTAMLPALSEKRYRPSEGARAQRASLTPNAAVHPILPKAQIRSGEV